MKAVLDPTWQSGKSEGMYLPVQLGKEGKNRLPRIPLYLEKTAGLLLRPTALHITFAFSPRVKI